MSGFSAEWLRQREPFDAAARAVAAERLQLARWLAALKPDAAPWRVIDLGCGTGANYRALAPMLAGPQQWCVVDHDKALLDAWPETLRGVVVGNEVLDAMPVQLLHFDGSDWFERGVAMHDEAFVWADRPTTLRPPTEGPSCPAPAPKAPPRPKLSGTSYWPHRSGDPAMGLEGKYARTTGTLGVDPCGRLTLTGHPDHPRPGRASKLGRAPNLVRGRGKVGHRTA